MMCELYLYPCGPSTSSYTRNQCQQALSTVCLPPSLPHHFPLPSPLLFSFIDSLLVWDNCYPIDAVQLLSLRCPVHLHFYYFSISFYYFYSYFFSCYYYFSFYFYFFFYFYFYYLKQSCLHPLSFAVGSLSFSCGSSFSVILC